MEAGEQYLVFCKDSVDREIVRVRMIPTRQRESSNLKNESILMVIYITSDFPSSHVRRFQKCCSATPSDLEKAFTPDTTSLLKLEKQ